MQEHPVDQGDITDSYDHTIDPRFVSVLRPAIYAIHSSRGSPMTQW
jgi:hypothetical protein